MAKLDEERAKNSKLSAKLSDLRNADSVHSSYESKLKEKDDIISAKDKELKEKAATIAKQQAYIQWLQTQAFGGRKSEKKRVLEPDSKQLSLNLDFGEESVSEEELTAYKKAEEEVQKYYTERKRASQVRKEKTAHKRGKLPEGLPRVEVHVYPDGYNEGEWELLPEEFDEITEVLERKPEELYVKRFIKHKAVRKGDVVRTIHAAPTPTLPLARGYAGASVLAHLMAGKYYDHLPFYRQIDMFKRVGVSLPPTTVNDWFLDVADLLRPIYFRIKDLVLGSDYIQSDETTVPVIRDEKNKTAKGYLWQVRAILLNLAFFHYDKGSRSQDVALALFAKFSGAIQVDGYAVYDMYEKKSGVLVLICWAHVRRCFFRAISNDKARAEHALYMIGLLYEIERKAVEDNLSYEEIEELRYNLALPVLYEFERWLKAEAPKVMPKSPIGKAINFTLERFDRLCRYCADGRFLVDNNPVENGQRKVALGRKNFLFCGNDDAAEDAAVIYTLMECCRMCGANFEKWMTYVLDHIHEYDNDYDRPLDELLPNTLHQQGIC